MILNISPTPSNTASNTPTNTNSGTPCPTTSATPTQTPTVSVSAPPPCPEEVTLTWLDPENTDASGTYYRVTNYTGGTFNYGWVDNFLPIDMNVGTSPDGRNYLVYVRTVGSTAYTLTNYYFLPTSTTRYYSVFKTEGSLVNGQVITNYGGQVIELTGTTIGGEYILSSGNQTGAGQQMYIAYPQICPTMTPTPSITSSQTATPTVTKTATQTLTPTPSPTFCYNPQAYLVLDAASGSTALNSWMASQGSTFRGCNIGILPSNTLSVYETQMNAYLNYSGWGVSTFYIEDEPIVSTTSLTHSPEQVWSGTNVWNTWFVPTCPFCDGGNWTKWNGANLNSLQYNKVFYYSGSSIPQGYYRWLTTYNATNQRLNTELEQTLDTLVGCVSPTPTPTITQTRTPSLTTTQTQTTTPSATPTITQTPSSTIGATATQTPSQTQTATPSITPTNDCLCFSSATVNVSEAGDITFNDCNGNPTIENFIVGDNQTYGDGTFCIQKDTNGGTAMYVIVSYNDCCSVPPPSSTPSSTPTTTNTPTITPTTTNTPTNTATQTITPTPSPTKVASYCIEAMNTGFGDYSFNYINCDNVLTFITIPGNDSGLLFVYCGSNPASQSGTGYAVQQPTECIDCACPPEPPPTPSMTQTNTATQTTTPTNTPTNTATQTNTPTPSLTPVLCNCIEAITYDPEGMTVEYLDCFGTTAYYVIPGEDVGLQFSFCGSLPVVIIGTGSAIDTGNACIGGACPPEPSPSQTATPTNTPTNTSTPTNTPTITPTPSITPSTVLETCAFLTVRTDASLNVPITGVEVNTIPVTYLSGSTFTITTSDPPGYFNTTQTGSSETVTVNYGSNISGQHIDLTDCNSVVHCCDLNPGGGTCTFTGVDLSCSCNWTIEAFDGTC